MKISGPLQAKRSIYMAGPLNCLAWVIYSKALAQELEDMGYIVHLPQEECAVFKKNGELDQVGTGKLCQSFIKISDIVLANLDGPDSDSGTSFEVGFTVASNLESQVPKIIIGYGTQTPELYLANKRKIKNPHSQYNAMFRACHEIVWQNAYETDIRKLAKVIHEAIMKHSA